MPAHDVQRRSGLATTSSSLVLAACYAQRGGGASSRRPACARVCRRRATSSVSISGRRALYWRLRSCAEINETAPENFVTMPSARNGPIYGAGFLNRPPQQERLQGFVDESHRRGMRARCPPEPRAGGPLLRYPIAPAWVSALQTV